MQTSEDTAMLSALKQDNKLEAYQFFFMKYYKPLCLRACQILGDADQARSMVQQIFIDVWKKQQYKDITESPGGFFYQLTEERCREKQAATAHDKNHCVPCQTGPALIPQTLHPQLS
jgi:DNA-directed RNA polymerase specialized sigma24 family protein